MLISRVAKQYKKIKDRNRISPLKDNLPTADDLEKRLGGYIYTVSQNHSFLELAVTSEEPQQAVSSSELTSKAFRLTETSSKTVNPLILTSISEPALYTSELNLNASKLACEKSEVVTTTELACNPYEQTGNKSLLSCYTSELHGSISELAGITSKPTVPCKLSGNTTEQAVRFGLASNTSDQAGYISELSGSSSELSVDISEITGNTSELAGNTNKLAVTFDIASISELASSFDLTSTSELAGKLEQAITPKLVTTAKMAGTPELDATLGLAATSELDNKKGATITKLKNSDLNMADVDSVLQSTSILPKCIPVSTKVYQVKEILEETITAEKNYSMTISESAEITPTLNMSTETNSEMEEPIPTIPAINFNWKQIVYEWLILFADGLAKRGTFSLVVMIIISYIIGYDIDDHSISYAISRLASLLPLLWIRQSDQITEYVVKKITDFFINC